MSARAPWVRHPMVADASAGAVPERAHLSSIGQNSAVGGRASLTGQELNPIAAADDVA